MQARTGGPFAVGSFDREWMLVSNCSCSEFCFAGHGASLVASLGGGERAGAGVAGVLAHAFVAAAVVSLGVERRGGAGDLGCAGAHESRSGALGGGPAPAAIDDLEGALAPWRLAWVCPMFCVWSG